MSQRFCTALEHTFSIFLANSPVWFLIKKLEIPILVVNGTHDIQVPVSEAELLLAAQPNAKKLIIEDMSHVLKPAPADRMGNIQTYGKADLALSEGLVEGILEFLRQLP